MKIEKNLRVRLENIPIRFQCGQKFNSFIFIHPHRSISLALTQFAVCTPLATLTDVCTR